MFGMVLVCAAGPLASATPSEPSPTPATPSPSPMSSPTPAPVPSVPPTAPAVTPMSAVSASTAAAVPAATEPRVPRAGTLDSMAVGMLIGQHIYQGVGWGRRGFFIDSKSSEKLGGPAYELELPLRVRSPWAPIAIEIVPGLGGYSSSYRDSDIGYLVSLSNTYVSLGPRVAVGAGRFEVYAQAGPGLYSSSVLVTQPFGGGSSTDTTTILAWHGLIGGRVAPIKNVRLFAHAKLVSAVARFPLSGEHLDLGGWLLLGGVEYRIPMH